MKVGNSTLREQLESVERQTGKRPKELLELAELPKSCYFVWKYFIDLHRARSSNGFSLNPISYSEIYAYSKLNGIFLTEEEVTIIRKFDSEVMSVYNDEAEKKQQAADNKPKK